MIKKSRPRAGALRATGATEGSPKILPTGRVRNAKPANALGVALLLAACATGSKPPTPVPAAPDRSAAAAAASVEAPPLPTASDAAADSLLVDVRSADSSIEVDARYATSDNFTGAPLPGYEAPRALARRELAAALGRVQARLRTGDLGLRVFDGYRPVRATLAMVGWAERTGRRALLDSGYIARRSRHNMGVAVDLTLVDRVTRTEVPMGTAFDTFTEAAHTANAEGSFLRYRQILVRVMESEGFTNYDQEWWHFTYPVEGAVPFDRVIR